MDEFRKFVRAIGLEYEEIFYEAIMFFSDMIDNAWWVDAEIGETYENGAWP
jgi:hypothetical protein